MRWRGRPFLILFILFLAARSVGANDLVDQPFYTFNQSPLAQIHGLPAIGAARILPPGSSRAELSYQVANNLVQESNATEALVLDGESHRTTLVLGWGLRHQIELGLELPYLSHNGGFLDDFIENWHSTFSLPQAGRDLLPRDRLTYYYRRNASVLLDFTEPTEGLGDVRLTAGHQLESSNGLDLALRGSLKLPTGDPEELRGSGATDLAVWLTGACSPTRCPGALGWQVAGGFAWLGRGDVLSDLQRRWVGFGSATTYWRVLPSLHLKAQLDLHSPLYQGSGLRPLGGFAGQLILGGTWGISADTALDMGVSEDIIVDSGPDVTLLLALRTLF